MDLVIKYPNVPLRSIPEQELNTIVLTKFMPWVIDLLSLTGEKSADRLEVALPALKTHCWSMGFDEIKKMFEMYADGKLSMQPKSNYFDRILLGQIFNDYKKQLPSHKNPKPETYISDDEKEFLWITFIVNCFEQYKHDGKMLTGFTEVYKHFYEFDKFPKHDTEFREQKRSLAIEQLKKEHKKDYSENSIAIKCKEIILGEWFDKLIKSKTDINNEI